MEKISEVYGKLWEFVEEALGWINEGGEKASMVTAIIGAVLGLFAIEKLYFTEAEHVRLLFVLILAPIGAGVGWFLGYLFSIPFRIMACAVVIGLAILISLAPFVLVIYILYSIVVWTN